MKKQASRADDRGVTEKRAVTALGGRIVGTAGNGRMRTGARLRDAPG